MRLLSLLTTLLLLPLTLHAPAQAQDNLSSAQQKQVEQLISDYLMKNPEALRSALENMQAHYQQLEMERKLAAIRDSEEELYYAKGDFSLGPTDAPITIVEFFDYNCGYCKRAFEPLMQAVKENEDVRLVFKELPILSEDSQRAAQIALALDDQLQFLTFHTKLMTHKGSINDVVIDLALEEMKLSPAKIRQASNEAKVQNILQRNQDLANRLGISGTPAFIINGEIHPGALDKASFDQLIAAAREEIGKN